MAHNYVVTAHKATAVGQSIVCHFTSPEQLNLIIAKAARVEKLLGVFGLHTLYFPKNLWRGELAEFPEYCSADTPQAECHMQCDARANSTWLQEVLKSSASNFYGDWAASLADAIEMEMETGGGSPSLGALAAFVERWRPAAPAEKGEL